MLKNWDEWSKTNTVLTYTDKVKSRPKWQGIKRIVPNDTTIGLLCNLNLINVIDSFKRGSIDKIEVRVDEDDKIVEPFFYLTILSLDIESTVMIVGNLYYHPRIHKVETLQNGIRVAVFPYRGPSTSYPDTVQSYLYPKG